MPVMIGTARTKELAHTPIMIARACLTVHTDRAFSGYLIATNLKQIATS